MKEMLCGIETEYGIHCDIAHLERILGPDKNYVHFVLRQISSLLPENDYYVTYRSTGEFWLRCGARIYADRGTHLEVATAECGTFADLVIQKNVGNSLALRLTEKTQEILRARPYFYRGPFELYANNTASEAGKPAVQGVKPETQFGCHENYLLRRDLFDKFGRLHYFDFIRRNLGCFFAARTVLGGAGHITLDGKFVLSPRMNTTEFSIGGGTTTGRALINTRDEPQADGEKFIRYHHIAGDTNITDHITKLKMAFTYWVLRLTERGWQAPTWLRLGDWQFENEERLLAFAREVNTDPELKKVHRIGDRSVSTTDVLMSYLEAVDTHRRELLFEDEDNKIFEEVARYLEQAKEGFMALAGESEWATKYVLMLAEMRKKNIGNFGDPRLRKLSLVLHNLDKNLARNPFVQLRNQVLTPNLEIGDLAKACRTAPRTRAFVRGLVVYLANKFGVALHFPSGAEWACFSTPVEPGSSQSGICWLNRLAPWTITKEDIAGVVRHMRNVAMYGYGKNKLPPRRC